MRPILPLLFFLPLGSLLAQTQWIGTTGSWFDDANWDNGAPSEDVAIVGNGGTAQVASGDGGAIELNILNNSHVQLFGTGVLNISEDILMSGSGSTLSLADSAELFVFEDIAAVAGSTISLSGNSFLGVDDEIALDLGAQMNISGSAELDVFEIEIGATSKVVLSENGRLYAGGIVGDGLLEISGGTLSAEFIDTAIKVTGSFVIEDCGCGVFIEGPIEIAGGDHVAQLSFGLSEEEEESPFGAFGAVILGNSITGSGNLSFQLAPSADAFAIVMFGDQSNTNTGTLTIGQGVYLGMAKYFGAVAISGGLDIQAGGLAVTALRGQFGANSVVNVDGTLVLFDVFSFELPDELSELPIELPFPLPFGTPGSETIKTLTGSGVVTTDVIKILEVAGLLDDLPDLTELLEGFELPKSLGITLTVQDGNFSGNIEEGTLLQIPLSLVKTGTGTLTLSGVNTFTGGLTVEQGLLVAGSNNALGLGTVLVNNTGTLQIASGVKNALAVQLNNFGTLSVYGEQNGNLITLGGSPTLGVYENGVVKGAIDLGASTNSQIILDPLGNRTLASMLRGPITNFAGDIVKQGSGTLAINDSFRAPGAFDVKGGTLDINSRLVADSMLLSGTSIVSVDGSLEAPTIEVGSRASLFGSGTIIGNVVNDGIVNPGNSPGTLTIRGNFRQTSSGTFTLEIASLTSYDQLRVLNGRAFLAGTLQISLLGGFTPTVGDTFEFITATDGVSGRFDRVISNAPIPYLLDYEAGSVVLEILSNRRPYTDFAQNNNQFSVANALEIYRNNNSSADFTLVAGILDFLPADQLRAAFDAISPLEIFALSRTALSIGNTQMSQLENHLLGFQNAFSFEEPVTAGPKVEKNVLPPAPAATWSAFVEGSGIFARFPTLGDIESFDYQTGAVTVGGDYPLLEKFRIGVFAGYAGTSVDLASGSDLSLDSARFGLYWGWNPLRALNVYGALSIGYLSYDYERRIQFPGVDRTANSNPSGSLFSGLLGGSYDIEKGNLTFGPFASVQYNLVSVDEFEETGAGSLNLRYRAQNDHSVRTNLGVKASYNVQVTPNITLTPQARLAWQHEYVDDPESVFARLDNGAGPGFTVTTPGAAEDSFLGSIGVTAQFNEHCSASAYYTANLAFDSDYVHAVQAAFRYTW